MFRVFVIPISNFFLCKRPWTFFSVGIQGILNRKTQVLRGDVSFVDYLAVIHVLFRWKLRIKKELFVVSTTFLNLGLVQHATQFELVQAVTNRFKQVQTSFWTSNRSLIYYWEVSLCQWKMSLNKKWSYFTFDCITYII